MRLVILERDGVINYDTDTPIRCPEQWSPIPGSLEAIALLNRADFHVVVATNQEGIARGAPDIRALTRIHEKMHAALKSHGGVIDAIFFCPHEPDAGCECRKPRPGLLVDIAERLQINIEGCPVIGACAADIHAAAAAGASPMLVTTGRAAAAGQAAEEPACPVYENLFDAVQSLLEDDDS